MKKLIVLFSFLSIIVFVSCNAVKSVLIEGAKVSRFKYSNLAATEILVLNDNKTFDYSYSTGLIHTKCSGEWSIDDRKLILNYSNDYQPGIREFKEIASEVDLIEINLLNKDQDPLLGAVVQLNDLKEQAKEVDDEGIALFKKIDNLEKLTIQTYGNSYDVKVKNKNSNQFNIIVELEDLSKCPRSDSIFLFKSKNKILSANNRLLKRAR